MRDEEIIAIAREHLTVEDTEAVIAFARALLTGGDPVGFIRPDTPGRYLFVNFYEGRNPALAWEPVYRAAGVEASDGDPKPHQTPIPSPMDYEGEG